MFAAIFTWVLGVQINHGNRMYPFILDGDLVVTYKLGGYREGDAVVYRDPESGRTAVSRIAAIGPAEIQISESGQLYIDGYTYEDRTFYFTKPLDGSELVFPYELEGERFFLLDDHRSEGKDSRLFGGLEERELLGKVVYLFRRRGL